MATGFWPFDAGAGSAITENQWRQMARYWLLSGYIPGALNELAVAQRGAGANMSVDVATGQAWIEGHYFYSDTIINVAIAANASGNPRIDRVVVQADFVANTIAVVVLQGTPAGSPTAPALTQDINTKWEVSLAQVAVANAAASIVTANITNERSPAVPMRGGNLSRVQYAPTGGAVTKTFGGFPGVAAVDTTNLRLPPFVVPPSGVVQVRMSGHAYLGASDTLRPSLCVVDQVAPTVVVGALMVIEGGQTAYSHVFSVDEYITLTPGAITRWDLGGYTNGSVAAMYCYGGTAVSTLGAPMVVSVYSA